MFKPKGDKSLAVIVVEMSAQSDHGHLLTFSVLGNALELDANQERQRIRQAVAAARPLLLRDHGKALVPLRGQGYRIAQPGELSGVAQEHRRRSERQIEKALAVIEHGDVSSGTEAERRRFQQVGMIVRNLHARMTDAESRLQQLEEAVFGAKPS